jgi:adenylate cyclase
MPIDVTIAFEGAETKKRFDADSLVIGRLESGTTGLDLSSDLCVSRQHAFLQVKGGTCWLTDLGSSYGTQLNGREIRGQGGCRVLPKDRIVIGKTILQVVFVPPQGAAMGVATDLSVAPGAEVHVRRVIDTNRPSLAAVDHPASPTEKRLALLLDLPSQFGAEPNSDALLQLIMNRVVAVIPHARRGALLLREPERDTLLLKAYVSGDEPAVSETLARRVLEEKRGLMWHCGTTGDPSRSARQHHIINGMYAPIQWQDQVFGVICVDSPQATDSFKDDDLEFLVTIGHYAGMAMSEQRLRAELQRNTRVVERLLANFSSKVRATLLEQARLGKLRPGGTKSEVTILFCDLIGFTQRAAAMDAHDVVDMLNDYFQPLVGVILQHDGTLDKFIGDAVLAVFGSPEADPRHHEKAVRAALAMQQAIQATSKLREARGDATSQVRIGLHCGQVFHGFIGTLERLEFTVIGDAVNRANRYCATAGAGEVMISPDLFQRVFGIVRTEKATVQTKEGELAAYRVKGLKPQSLS